MSNALAVTGTNGGTVKAKLLRIDLIPKDNRIQMREKLSRTTVAEFAQAMEESPDIPPVVAFQDETGAHWLADGNHRVAAAERLKFAEIKALVHSGSKEDAILFAAQANQAHGLRRSQKDKRRAIRAVLLVRPNWSAQAIAEHVGVDPKTVISEKEASVVEIPQLNDKSVIGKDGKRYRARKVEVPLVDSDGEFNEQVAVTGFHNAVSKFAESWPPEVSLGPLIATLRNFASRLETREKERARE